MSDQSVAPRLQAYLKEREAAMLDLLESLVRAESPSLVPESQGRVFDLLTRPLEACGFRVRRIPGRRSGGMLYARPSTAASPTQLLLGHADTVWPLGTLQEMPLETGDGTLKGPGVFDMKAGLTQMVYALKALFELGLEPTVTPVVLISSDEEIGSYDSEAVIRRLAGRANRAFVLEPSLGRLGLLKTTRKGVGEFQIRALGRAAHAGLAPESGASAILEMSYLIQKLFALNDADRGISVNVGTVEGGLRANVVAPECTAVVDVRVAAMKDARRIEKAIRGLIAQTPGVEVKVEGEVDRPPLENTPRNEYLWELARKAAAELQLDLGQGSAGGASDGNITSQCTATLDGLGAVGGGAHASHEFVYTDKLGERAALLALLILSPPVPESVLRA